MFKLVSITLVLLGVYQVTPSDKLGSNDNIGSSFFNIDGSYLKYPNFKEYFNKMLTEEDSRPGLGISAWGIVAIVISIILGIMGMYFISICYPIFCNSPRKYDEMDKPNVA